jgi:hypothetical protein
MIKSHRSDEKKKQQCKETESEKLEGFFHFESSEMQQAGPC